LTSSFSSELSLDIKLSQTVLDLFRPIIAMCSTCYTGYSFLYIKVD